MPGKLGAAVVGFPVLQQRRRAQVEARRGIRGIGNARQGAGREAVGLQPVAFDQRVLGDGAEIHHRSAVNRPRPGADQ
ncbi:hypothetical protein D3C83_10210 [compost metagenome]